MDIVTDELVVIAPLLLLMILLGLYPYLITQAMPALGIPLPGWR
jgi:NADH:ubiquinone oxidoreductase subunit 4 (subunit M)